MTTHSVTTGISTSRTTSGFAITFYNGNNYLTQNYNQMVQTSTPCLICGLRKFTTTTIPKRTSTTHGVTKLSCNDN